MREYQRSRLGLGCWVVGEALEVPEKGKMTRAERPRHLEVHKHLSVSLYPTCLGKTDH